MRQGHEKSDPAIVAVKPANKAKKSTAETSAGEVAAEPGERRAGTKGNEGQQSTCRAQNRKRVTGAGTHTPICRHTPEVGAVCGKAARTVLCGGRAMKRTSLLFFNDAAAAEIYTLTLHDALPISSCLVASVAWPLATVVAKRTQRLHG